LVHLSSAITYTAGLGEPIREDFPQHPLHEPHAVTKAEGDKLVQRMILQDGLPAVIIRPEAMFGAHDRINFRRLADRLRAGKGIIIGSGRNAVPFVYVTDVVQGLLLALEHPHALGQAYNITNDIEKARRELGYEPQVPLREGIRLAGAWYREHVLGSAAAPPRAAV
jgi:nucleoside-diphosphate-sugar epimerase